MSNSTVLYDFGMLLYTKNCSCTQLQKKKTYLFNKNNNKGINIEPIIVLAQ